MKIVRFTDDSKVGYGILRLETETIETCEGLFESATFAKALEYLTDSSVDMNKVYPLSDTALEAPVQPTKNVICIGKNYRDHILEGGGTDAVVAEVKENPIFFTKPISSIIGPDATISSHSHLTDQLDYEGELGVVIGKKCKMVEPDQVMDHIFGYVIINDVTARNLQKAHKQWLFGKGLDTLCPVGPYITTKDEISDPQNLIIKTKVNNELRQNESTSLMIHSIANQISFLSKGITLEPGDVLATGTPQGVGKGFKPPKFLKQGDVIEISIEGLGALKNRVQ